MNNGKIENCDISKETKSNIGIQVSEELFKVKDTDSPVYSECSNSQKVQSEIAEALQKCIELNIDENNTKHEVSCTISKEETSVFGGDDGHLNICNQNTEYNLSTVEKVEAMNSIDSNEITEELINENKNWDKSKGCLQKKSECNITNIESTNLKEPVLYTNGIAVNIEIEYKEYQSEVQMQDIMKLIQAELSEPYSIYTYRYFIYNWPKLCFLATHGDKYVGAIVCKLDLHMNVKRGYIAMLAVKKEYRKLKIGTNLVQKAIDAMLADNADEVVLETEMKNVSALRLYENLGFVRDKRLFRYYLNGVDALRLKLWFN